MTEQEKIEIFANYLPYGVTVAVDTIYVGFTTELVISNHTNSLKNGMNINQAIEYDTKLILHPLSNLTKPIKVDDVTYIDDLSQSCDNHIEFGFIKAVLDSGKLLEKPFPYWAFKWLLRNHFDVFGLIGQGLAIDINTLKNNTL